MTTITIDHLHHRFRVADQAQLPRLQAIAELLPAALSAELDRRGADPAVVICFRRLHSRYRAEGTNLDSPAAQARRWAAEVAAALMAGAPTRGAAAGWANDDDAPVLLFANEHAVVADVLLKTGAGDLRHRWAWEMASVVAPSDPADPARLAATVLARHPRLLCAGLRSLLGGQAGVPAHWPWSTWLALAAGIGASAVPVPQDLRDLRDLRDTARAGRLPATPEYVLLLALICGALAGAPAPDAGPAPWTGVPAVAALLVAAAAPELAGDRLAIAAASAQIRATASALGSGHNGAAGPADTGVPASRRTRTADPPGAEPGTALPVAPAAAGGQQPASTTAGGLPFLLHLVVRQELPARLTGAPTAGSRAADVSVPADPARDLRGRPLAQVLGELGRRLAGCAPADPALLAFLGRLPGDELPEAPPYSAPEHAALEQLVGEIDQLLESLLPRPAAEHGRALRSWVINRPAEVAGAPGWIEVGFRADRADTELRKAGLDLDPGYLPFLGSVVRFRYV